MRPGLLRPLPFAGFFTVATGAESWVIAAAHRSALH